MEIPASFSLLLFLALSTPMSVVSSWPWSSLEVGFYSSTCPEAESIVKNMVDNFISSNPGIGASLIRLHFHDCFVRGCDASVLIDSTPSNPSEQASPINLSLRGFDQIAAIKAAIEAACPGTVSCADILAFAARDSAAKLGNISYQVPAGRRDGTVSLESDPLKPNNIPQFTYNLSQLTANFEAKGLSPWDMVILSGAHSVGIAHCSSFTNRLYPELDPTLDPALAAQLRKLCPSSNTTASNPTAPLDQITPNKLDNGYYQDLALKRVLLTSDQSLMTSSFTANLSKYFQGNGGAWAYQFAGSMVRMGYIDVLTGSDGEIRKVCSSVN